MLTPFDSLEAWTAEALKRGYVVIPESYEDIGGPESGPDLSYAPALACGLEKGEGDTYVVYGVFCSEVRPKACGVLCDTPEECDAWDPEKEN
jgi:hypothetical protein